jgi:hypothetical protein
MSLAYLPSLPVALAAVAIVISAMSAILACLAYASVKARLEFFEDVLKWSDEATSKSVAQTRRAAARAALLSVAGQIAAGGDRRFKNRLIARLLDGEAERIARFAEGTGEMTGADRGRFVKGMREHTDAMRPPVVLERATEAA